MEGAISVFTGVLLFVMAVQGQSCPEFSSHYEEEDLIISMNEGCEMVVGTLDISRLSGRVQGVAHTGAGIIPPSRPFHIPTVTYRRPWRVWNAIRSGAAESMCPPYPVRYLGPRVVIDTVVNECQKVLGIRSFPVAGGNTNTGFPGSSMVMRARPVFENLNRLV